MALSHLLRLQKRILDSIEDDLAFYKQRKSRELQTYEREYVREFRRGFQVASKAALLKRMHRSQIVYCGDFHSFRQSQKTAIRLLRDAILADPKYILCVECIPAEYQAELDAFHRGEFGIERLRERVRWSDIWPFPWDNYKNLFEFARENGIRIIGLESRREPLAERDLDAARLIADAAMGNPEHHLFVFYGDLHLARRHLPRATREILRSNGLPYKATVIFQNEPRIFWQLARDGAAHTTDVVRLRDDTWCIMNATPWVRLQSYVDWLEGETSDARESEDEENEAGGNIAGKLNAFARLLQNFLRLEPVRDIDVTVYTFDDIQSFEALLSRATVSIFKAKTVRYAILLSRPVFLPEDKVVYVPSSSLNLLAEAAALALRDSLVPDEEVTLSPRLGMGRLILNAARAYLGSKVINPKRKCEEVADIDAFLAETKGRKRNSLRFKRASFQWARREIDWLFGDAKRIFRPRDGRFTFASGWEAARLAGSVLAERLHYALLEGGLSLEEVDRLFSVAVPDEETARCLLREFAAVAMRSGYPIRSKLEKL